MLITILKDNNLFYFGSVDNLIELHHDDTQLIDMSNELQFCNQVEYYDLLGSHWIIQKEV